MERLAVSIPLLLAACFAFSVAFLLGTAAGSGHMGWIWLLTFSDITNFSSPMLGVAAIIIFISLLNFHTLRSPLTASPQLREKPKNIYYIMLAQVVVLQCLLMATAYFSGALSLSIALAGCALPFVMIVPAFMFMHFAEGRLSNQEAIVGTGFVAAVACALICGTINGYVSTHDGRSIEVTLNGGDKITAPWAIVLERGVVLNDPGSMRLVPWSEVRVMQWHAVGP